CTTSAKNASSAGYAPVEDCGDHRLANSDGLGNVTFACRLVQPRKNVNSSAARLRRLRSGATTASPSGRAIVASPTSDECHSPHSQALTSTPAKPSQAAVSSLWNDSRRISPSLTTGRPTSSSHPPTSRTPARRPTPPPLDPRGRTPPRRIARGGSPKTRRPQPPPPVLTPRMPRHNPQHPTPRPLPHRSVSPRLAVQRKWRSTSLAYRRP